MRTADLSGQRFGRLLAISYEPTRSANGKARSTWRCVCDCGKQSLAESSALRLGKAKSCGCGQHSNPSNKYGKPHHKRGSVVHGSWACEQVGAPYDRTRHRINKMGLTFANAVALRANFRIDQRDQINEHQGMEIPR